MRQAIKLSAHGGDRRSEEARKARQDQGDNVTLKRGDNATYIRARLHRDHPELAAAMDRGEFRSARAAAIEAGIIRPVPVVRCHRPLRRLCGPSWLIWLRP